MDYILDTSFIIAYINPLDSSHAKAILWSQTINLDNTTIYFTDLVYAETLTVLKIKKNTSLIPHFLKTIKARNVRLLSIHSWGLIERYEKYHTHCSYTDISIIHAALQNKANILTFDQELLKTATSLGYQPSHV